MGAANGQYDFWSVSSPGCRLACPTNETFGVLKKANKLRILPAPHESLVFE
jgi:hypothetical protein